MNQCPRWVLLMKKNGGGKSHATVPLMPKLQAVIGGTLQNVPRQYVPQTRCPEYKKSQDITSQLLNVPITKRASYNTTKASEPVVGSDNGKFVG